MRIRIIKLSKDDPDTGTKEKLKYFFEKEIWQRKPEGRFNFKYGRINKNEFSIGEYLIFTHSGEVVYIGKSSTEIRTSKLKDSDVYFCIDRKSCKAVYNKPFKELEKLLNIKIIREGWQKVIIPDKEADEIFNILAKPIRKKPKITVNPEENKKIEHSAVTEAIKYYEKRNFKVDSVEDINLGWDLQAKKDGEIALRIEVKGHKGDDIHFELTPNEYEKMQHHHQTYRVFVVLNALSNDKICPLELTPQKENGKWVLISECGRKITLAEKTAARASETDDN